MNKGDPRMVSNYRPISLLSNVNKIFERIVNKRLYSFLNKYNCIYMNYNLVFKLIILPTMLFLASLKRYEKHMIVRVENLQFAICIH